MTDRAKLREKVLNGLEGCTGIACAEKDCPYFKYGDLCVTNLAIDARKLLKEQEPVEPIVEHSALELSNTNIRFMKKHYCGICKEEITRTNAYCHRCGRKVKWNEDAVAGADAGGP